MTKRPSRRALLAMSPLLAAPASAATASNPLETVRSRMPADRGRFMMPAHFGPMANPSPAEFKTTPGPGTRYGEVSTISVNYLTDGQMLSRFLPEPFELAGPPLVIVNYSRNREIEWLAGGSYNIVAVFVPATYKGKQDQVTGGYALVLWENLTDPILTGRDQGIPKIFGDIEDHQIEGDSWRTSLSRNGHKILDLRASAMKPFMAEQMREAQKAPVNSQMLGWRYVPNETFTGGLASYATVFPTTSSSLRQAWTAQGSLEWHPQTWSQNPTQAHIVNAMHSLPVKEIRACTVTIGSVALLSGSVRRLI